MYATVEEQNRVLNEEGFAGYESALIITFRDRKKNFFTVKYGEHGHGRQNPYFSTSAGSLNYIRSDWDRVGQAQEDVLKNRLLKTFFRKWDNKHLSILTLEEMEELEEDLNELMVNIPYIKSDRFYDIVSFDRELS